MERVWILVALLAVVAAAGLVWRRRTGRLRTVRQPAARPGEPELATAHLAAVGVDPTAHRVTLVQFSSAFCAPCRATKQVLTEVTAMLPGVAHVEVDAESHLDTVRALDIRSTPTTLVVDATGRVVKRAVGLPRKADVIAAVGPLLPDTSTR